MRVATQPSEALGLCWLSMNTGYTSLVVILFLSVLTALFLADPVHANSDCDGVSEADQLTAEAKKWLAEAGEAGLLLVEDGSQGSFVKQFGTQFSYTAGAYAVSFGMNKDIAASDLTLELLQREFRYFSIESLPLPGFQGLDGWEVFPQTPSSSFSEGVQFVSLLDGVLTIRVKTSFFQIYGFDTRVDVPADAGAPEGSFFSVQRTFPLDLTLTAPIS